MQLAVGKEHSGRVRAAVNLRDFALDMRQQYLLWMLSVQDNGELRVSETGF